MKKDKYYIKSEEGEINKIVLDEESVAHIEMKEDSVLYVKTALNSENGNKSIDKQVWLSNLVDNYKGPSVYFDFTDEGELIGVEILGD